MALVSGSRQQLLRRLQLLFQHGYLERPRAQIDYYGQGGSQSMVYGLGNKGAKLLKAKFGMKLRHLRWNEKNQGVRRVFLAHALAIADVMVALELGARIRPDLILTWHDEFKEGANRGRFWRWRVRVNRKTTLGVIPDRAFSIETNDSGGKRESRFFFLEVDRGTMPVIRKNLSQTSFHRKLLAYEATWANGLHQKLFGIDRFRILTVTMSATRVASFVDACAKLKRGHRLFLFSDLREFVAHRDVFAAPCHSGKPGEITAILP